jgi:transposase-like protein
MVDHVTVFRWVQRFTPEFIEAARPCRRAPVYPRVLDELVPSALHTVEQHANDPIEADHGRLKARLRPMRGLKRHRSVRVLAAGHMPSCGTGLAA